MALYPPPEVLNGGERPYLNDALLPSRVGGSQIFTFDLRIEIPETPSSGQGMFPIPVQNCRHLASLGYQIRLQDVVPRDARGQRAVGDMHMNNGASKVLAKIAHWWL